jgi:hypothetical protein
VIIDLIMISIVLVAIQSRQRMIIQAITLPLIDCILSYLCNDFEWNIIMIANILTKFLTNCPNPLRIKALSLTPYYQFATAGKKPYNRDGPKKTGGYK